ncbi:fucolectin-4-like [Dreissena polymorpha]|uniref:Fucolectin tachylectin-4 pentraxin-1 domain-containing protein n=1 Tax=Dreissena polymorpha TaxID=45954 RepID=A0A9D4D528_DREPO|nr:fucolectin-4-like [Dreissena polymorpha]KAH3738170.1 hypothetical protein DPMN_044798 [Dreissena polymorpha]
MKGWNFYKCLIVQVSVLLQTADAVNVALGKPANQTDTYGKHTANRAVDGNTSPDLNNQSCAHTLSHNASWWVNLEKIFLIRSVKIYNRNGDAGNRLHDVELYVGLSERGFQSLEGFHHGQVGASYTFELATPVYGQWVRITRRNPLDKELTLCEVEVEGVPYSAANGVLYSVFNGYVHTSTAIDVSAKVGSKRVCASRCAKTENCISAYYNTATLTCSLFDSLAFQKGDIENDVTVVNSIAITNNSREQLFGK